MGKTHITSNVCNIFEPNRKFGWISGKLFASQFTFHLEAEGESTRLHWVVETEDTGIVQLAEPLVERRIQAMIEESLAHFMVDL